MSRGFVKEGDQEEPVVIPQRAVLPEGVINYVTPAGLQALQEELLQLEKDFAALDAENENELRRSQTLITGKINLLQERIATARPIRPEDQPQNEVRFGAKVTIKSNKMSGQQQFQITGVDEADVAQGKISFTTPIARALMGAQLGETVSFSLGNEVRELEVRQIEY